MTQGAECANYTWVRCLIYKLGLQYAYKNTTNMDMYP